MPGSRALIVQSRPGNAFEKPASVSAAAGLAELAPARTENDLSGAKTMEIKIVDFPQTRVAMLQHRGNPDRVK